MPPFSTLYLIASSIFVSPAPDGSDERYAMSELFIIEIYSSAVYFLLIFILLFKLGQFFYLRLGFVEILVAERDELRPLFKELQ